MQLRWEREQKRCIVSGLEVQIGNSGLTKLDIGAVCAQTDMELKQFGDRLVRFAGGSTGVWRVTAIRPVLGDVLPQVARVAVYRGDEPLPRGFKWTLSGVVSNIRYVERPEQKELASKQAPLVLLCYKVGSALLKS